LGVRSEGTRSENFIPGVFTIHWDQYNILASGFRLRAPG
jgi:hypothetical protein